MKIDQKAFLTSLKAALVSAAKSDARWYLGGVLIEKRRHDSAWIVSTDGHRLFRVCLAAHMPDEWPEQVILSRDSVAALLKAAKIERYQADDPGQWAKLSIEGDRVTFEHGSTLARLDVVEGRYPDWPRVVPDFRNVANGGDTASMVGINARYLQDAGKALALFGGRDAAVTFYPGADDRSSVTLECRSPDIDCESSPIVVIMPVSR